MAHEDGAISMSLQALPLPNVLQGHAPAGLCDADSASHLTSGETEPGQGDLLETTDLGGGKAGQRLLWPQPEPHTPPPCALADLINVHVISAYALELASLRWGGFCKWQHLRNREWA